MITANELYFSYTDAPPWVLQALNLQVKPGDYISVVGDNGSGKSTLIRLLLAFLKPTKGSIEMATGNIGYVPQRRDATDAGFPISLYESLNAYRKLKKRPVTAIQEAVASVGLADKLHELLGNLSGGQQQKALIARALIGKPSLVILDEPSTGIDPTSQREIYQLLNTLNREQGMTIVSVEHNLEAAVFNSTKIYHLHGGSGHLCSPERFRQEYLA